MVEMLCSFYGQQNTPFNVHDNYSQETMFVIIRNVIEASWLRIKIVLWYAVFSNENGKFEKLCIVSMKAKIYICSNLIIRAFKK